jgi:hypothetical protein
MTKHINFEDSIFILTRRIRLIQDLLALDGDPGLFFEKTIEDIDFIDTALETLLDNLGKNNRLIEREIQYENLADMEWQFSRVLTELLDGSGGISAANFPMLREKIDIIKKHGLDRNKTIETLQLQMNKAPIESVVSSDELNELLKGQG